MHAIIVCIISSILLTNCKKNSCSGHASYTVKCSSLVESRRTKIFEMKTLFVAIFLTITFVTSQDTFPPCKWSSAQWTTFKQCVGSATSEIITKCIRQQTSAKDWNAVKKAICSNASKRDGVRFKFRVLNWIEINFVSDEELYTQRRQGTVQFIGELRSPFLSIVLSNSLSVFLAMQRQSFKCSGLMNDLVRCWCL